MNILSKQIEADAKNITVLAFTTIILGVLALMSPILAGLGASAMAAILLMAFGIACTLYAFKAKSFAHGFGRFLFGGAALAFGTFMLAMPFLGLETFTLVVLSYLIFDGVFTTVTAFKLRPVKGWGWTLLSGISSLVLAGLIIYAWPQSAAWAIGTMLGISFIFKGTMMLTLASIESDVAGGIQHEMDTLQRSGV